MSTEFDGHRSHLRRWQSCEIASAPQGPGNNSEGAESRSSRQVSQEASLPGQSLPEMNSIDQPRMRMATEGRLRTVGGDASMSSTCSPQNRSESSVDTNAELGANESQTSNLTRQHTNISQSHSVDNSAAGIAQNSTGSDSHSLPRTLGNRESRTASRLIPGIDPNAEQSTIFASRSPGTSNLHVSTFGDRRRVRNSNVSDPRRTIAETYDSSAEEGLSRINMGYTDDTDYPSAWSVPDCDSDKMEASTQQTASDRSDNTNERQGDDDDTTIKSLDDIETVESPAMTPLHGQNIPEPQALAHHSVVLGTPSTISTAPSTDGEASIGMEHAMERLAFRMDAAYGADSARYHRRVSSWETSPHHVRAGSDHSFGSPALPPAYAPQPAPMPWTNVHDSRVASFRGEADGVDQHGRYGFPPIVPSESRWQQQPRFVGEPSLPFLPGRGASGPMDNRMYRQPQNTFNPYQVQQQQQQHRKPAGYPHQPPLPPTTPPRARTQRFPTQSPYRPPQTPAGGTGGQSHSGTGGQRSSSEVLKTLLRKKACLYEPDTSRAIALVTWLVGRVLALEYGFFSRQQLQAGVHACVTEKIESGAITRTKVNRCMQIILNSCFHYIIPRPDGTEENGEAFCRLFSEEVRDDSALIEMLPAPWNDLVVDRDSVLSASVEELEKKGIRKPQAAIGTTTPQSSPRTGSLPSPDVSPSKESDGDGSDAKRAVLLCFNENVRCAEAVFRCHNEFIRDTANASNLQLSAQEWHQFFGKEAAESPYLWGNVGIPVPYSEHHGPAHPDALGMMTNSEASKFRTSWCAKRYDHSSELCGFAHVEANGGWLRRNPAIHAYNDQMCPCIVATTDRRVGQQIFIINECPRGVDCEYAHSAEEIKYHPRRYKSKQCSSLSRPGGCPLGDICPKFHPADSYRFPKKSDGRSGSRHAKQAQQASASKGVQTHPAGAPILYASPAPASSFERHLYMPGLQNLYRRHCSVVRAHLRAPGTCVCCYSYFGDDSCVNVNLSSGCKPKQLGLPQPTRDPDQQ